MPDQKTDTRSPEQTGAEGGHQRAENLSPGRRHEIAVNAANARWGNRDALGGATVLELVTVPTARVVVPATEFDASDLADARIRVATCIVRRQGQPAFRRQLLEIYCGACAFSGCRVEAVLDAAHIVPYRGTATNDPRNGLLLRTDLHTLFDLGLLAVDASTMTILVASNLTGTEYASLAGKSVAAVSNAHLAASRSALNEQRRLSGL